jgi:hypothetical protein
VGPGPFFQIDFQTKYESLQSSRLFMNRLYIYILYIYLVFGTVQVYIQLEDTLQEHISFNKNIYYARHFQKYAHEKNNFFFLDASRLVFQNSDLKGTVS